MRPLSLGGLRNASAGVIAASLFLLPNFVAAYPFGGSIMQIIFCYNKAIYAAVGPPNGGPFIWTPSTKTYPFGPPQHVGQWLLGLVAPPYYCIVSKQPVIVWSGVLMTMEGSSGAAAPAGGIPVSYPSGGPGGGTPPGGGPGTPGGPSNSIGHVVISEVYPYPDLSHGNTSQYAWIELYNGSSAAVDLSQIGRASCRERVLVQV